MTADSLDRARRPEQSPDTGGDRERLPLGRMQNPVRGMLHGGAALAAIVGLVVLAARHTGPTTVELALVAYAGCLVAMFGTSSLYHSVDWSASWKRRMRRLDHAAIFLVVAGTYTPIAAVALEGAWRSVSLTAVWTVAVVGIALKLTERRIRIGLSITLQNVIGWATVVPMAKIGGALGWDTVAWIAAGGLVYTAGLVVFATDRPRLFPRVFSAHELFHVLVVVAATVHFLVILQRVVPAA